MKKILFPFLLIGAIVLAQQEKPPKQPQKQPPKTEKKKKKTLKIYVAVYDYINGKRIKYKATQFIICEAFRISKLANKEKFIEERVRYWKKNRKYPKLDDASLRQKAEEIWSRKRKYFGLTGLDYNHIELLKVKKKKKKEEKKPEEELVPDNGEGSGDDRETDKEQTDPLKIADILIEGRVDTLRKEPSRFLGEIVTYNAEATSDIKVVDARTKKVLAHIVKKHKMGAAKHKGQGRAYQNAIKAVAEDVVKEILALQVIRSGARKFEEKPPPSPNKKKK